MKVKKFKFSTGESYSILIGDNNLPMNYPNLFVTSMYRNDDQSSDSCKKAHEHISYFYEICKDLNIDIERRYESEDFLSQPEIQKIAYFTGITKKAAKEKLKIQSNVISINQHKPKLLETARHKIRVEKEETRSFGRLNSIG